MPENQVFTVFKSKNPESRKRRPKYSIASAYKELRSQEGNMLFKTLDVITSGQYFLAGAAKGAQEGESKWEAGLQGIARRASFRDLGGDPFSGFAMDVLFDPINLIPGVLLAKAGGKGIRGTVKGIRMLPGGSRLVDELGEKFVIDYLLKRGNYSGFIRLKNTLYGRLNYARSQQVNHWAEKIVEVLPEESSRRKIVKVYDDKPILMSKDAPEYRKWNEDYIGLTSDEKRGYLYLEMGLNDLENRRRAAKLITADQAAGFIMASGRRYVPRYYATKENAIAHLMARRTKMHEKLGSIKLTKNQREFVQKELDSLDKHLNDLENMPEVIGPYYRDKIHRYYQKDTDPDFIRKRKHKEKIEDLPDELFKSLETDAAVVLDIAYKQTETAIHGQKFVADAVRYLRKMGLVVPRKLAGRDPDSIVREMKKLGMNVDRRILTSPLEQVKTQRLQSFMVPKDIADDLNRVLKSYTDPKHQKEILNAWDHSTRWWKAFTLMPFPGYHIRNGISNIWNMGFDMKPHQYITHKKPAFGLLRKIKMGTLDDTTYQYGKKTYTDKQMMEGALHNRVIGGGEIAGEVGGVYADSGNILKGVLDPKRNWFTKYGYKIGRYIEDSDRMTYWMYRLSKGDTMAEAGAMVQKRLFDYQYGLTPFEQKWLRNRMVPFWAWTKFNMPYSLEMLVRHPQRYVRYHKARRTVEDVWAGPEPDETYFADWLKRSGKMRVRYDAKSGTYLYFMFDSWWPGADIGKLHYSRVGREFLNMITPMAKLPFELTFGYNFFRFQKMERFPGEKARMFGKELNIPLSKRIEHFARTFRVVNEADRIIQAMSKEYSTDFGSRFVRGGTRALLGKPIYTVKYESQIRSWNYRTRKQIGQLKAARSVAVKYGGKHNVEIIDKQVKELEDLREKHLKIRTVKRALKKKKRSRK